MDLDPMDIDIDRQLEILDEIEDEERASRSSLAPSSAPEPVTVPAPKRRKTLLAEERVPAAKQAPTSAVIKPQPVVLNDRIPETGDYVPITFLDGRRKYLAMEEIEHKVELPITSSTRQPLVLDELSKLVESAERLLSFKRIIDTGETNGSSDTSAPVISESLWVKKYEPARYLDLISSETVNRQLLSWLKAWDYSVFGIEPKASGTSTTNTSNDVGDRAPPASTTSSAASRFGGGDKSGQSAPGTTANKYEAAAAEKELNISMLDTRDGRPFYHLVLLSGPPGLGKTTLAHLLARHAGYQVIETNSSDDRSPAAMRDRLETVASSQTSLNPSTAANATVLKPSCLILDEVDGALPAAVEVLAAAACNIAPTAGERRRAAKKRNALVLRRPVICICNDLYAPSLRPLRAPGVPCYILRLPSVDLNRLITRLDWIARTEDIVVGKNFLSNLADSSGRDIRACLNALQFLKAAQKQGKDFSTLDLPGFLGLHGSLKDSQHNLFSAWQAVFTIPPPHVLSRQLAQMACRRQTTTAAGSRLSEANSASDSSLQARVKQTLDVCQSAGESQTLHLGIFENYLSRRMKDASLQTTRKAADWLAYSDLLWNRIQTAQDYSLCRYPGVLPAWFHLSFASTAEGGKNWGAAAGDRAFSTIRWPTSYMDNQSFANRSEAVIESVLENQWRAAASASAVDSDGVAVPTSLRCLTRQRFLLDASSYVNTLFSAMCSRLRPVNVQLYTDQEKKQLIHLVSFVVNMGLDLVPAQVEDSEEQTYRLEPPLDSVARFTSSTRVDKEASYATKQMLARELVLERMRRAEAAFSSHQTPSSRQESSGWPKTNTPSLVTSARAPLPNSFMSSRMGPTAKELLDAAAGAQKGKPLPQSHVTSPIAPLPEYFVSFHMGPTVKQLLDAAAGTQKVARDFFGRPIVKKIVSPSSKENVKPAPRCPINQEVWFKFKQGHSNAVRRPCLMSHLI